MYFSTFQQYRRLLITCKMASSGIISPYSAKESGNDLRLKELYPNLVSSLIEDVEIREILKTFHGPSLSVKSHILREAAMQANR